MRISAIAYARIAFPGFTPEYPILKITRKIKARLIIQAATLNVGLPRKEESTSVIFRVAARVLDSPYPLFGLPVLFVNVKAPFVMKPLTLKVI